MLWTALQARHHVRPACLRDSGSQDLGQTLRAAFYDALLRNVFRGWLSTWRSRRRLRRLASIVSRRCDRVVMRKTMAAWAWWWARRERDGLETTVAKHAKLEVRDAMCAGEEVEDKLTPWVQRGCVVFVMWLPPRRVLTTR